jgi:hypothetical protein
MDLLDEIAQHLLGYVEVGDHTISEWAYGGDVGRCPADHPLGLHPDGQRLVVVGVDGHHRGLVEHDALPAHIHECVGGAKVDGHVLAGE